MRFGSSFTRKARTLTAVALAATMLLPVQSMAQKKEVTTWRVQSHWPASSSSYKDSLISLKDKLAERTDGRLVLELYDAGSLFGAKETFNAVRRGIIPMATISPGYIIDQVPLAGVASGLPFAFRKVEEAAYFHKEMGFEQMMRDAVGKYGVYYSTDKVYPTEMVVKNPINSYDDFTKLKIRSSGALQVFLTQAGASGSFVSGAELYTALSQGVIDGAHWGAVQGAYSMSLYEVAKYHVRPALNIAGTDVFIINQKALDKLPADIRQTVIDTLDEQFVLRTAEYQRQEEEALAKAQKELGVKVNMLPQDALDKLTETAQKIWEQEAARGPESAKAVEMLKKYLSELGYL
ncbi:MAG TPA: TRAP transporter substrate-binding protein DctP [Gammaproteobacteria bacterium]|nr:TRAP transporter substrate-binding protein DctP [Gammaproteobacteria bacterium]